MNLEKIRKYGDRWAYDLDKSLSKGELYNEDVINSSIDSILMTLPGEKLFNPAFGSNFKLRIFNTMDEDFLEVLIDDTVGAIKRWENRITILENKVIVEIYRDSGSAYIYIPYIVNERSFKAVFERQLTQ